MQIIPTSGRDLDADVARAASVVKNFPGIADVRPYTKEESAGLRDPRLGSGLALNDQPVPRMIVVKLSSGRQLDLTASYAGQRGTSERLLAPRYSAISFMGLMVAVITANFPLIIVDEPEAFLHPPQARLLGRKLATNAPGGRKSS